MSALDGVQAKVVERVRAGPWLFGKTTDLLAFGGSAAFAISLVALGQVMGFGRGALPEWAWLAFVLAIDVAHVYSTLFRTYFDGAEINRHRLRYYGVPLVAYGVGVSLHLLAGALFWTVLAYLAVFHFIRQQVGWLALYRAREPDRDSARPSLLGARGVRLVEDGALYAVMVYPLLHWHAHLDSRRFAWLIDGDFVNVAALIQPFLPVASAITGLLLAAYGALQIERLVQARELAMGKNLLLFTTALSWNLGIVVVNSDFAFTVTNVVVHGVPYMVLLWTYSSALGRRRQACLSQTLLRGGVPAFLGVLLVLALIEEWAWHRWVWPDHELLFGTGRALPPEWLSWVVPLLALPQMTHYLLDGMLWRRKDTATSEVQQAALGLASTGGSNR